MYLCCSEVESWGMFQWTQETSEKSFRTQVCNIQGHKHWEPRQHWEGVQQLQTSSRARRLQDFCHPSEEKFWIFFLFFKMARGTSDRFPEWSVFCKTSRIRRKSSEIFPIFFVSYWGILISLCFASFLPRAQRQLKHKLIFYQKTCENLQTVRDDGIVPEFKTPVLCKLLSY